MNIRVRYINTVTHNCTNSDENRKDVLFWRNRLFATTIVYLLPLSLIALLPGLYWIYKIGQYVIGVVDILTVGSMVVIAFVPGISVAVRKILFISSAYLFSFAILYYVGLNGPGLVYLLTACIFSILIFSTSWSYWSAFLNTFICAVLAFLIWLDLMPSNDHRAIGEWIAVSSNMIFVSFLCVALIPRLFKNLQDTIEKEVEWQTELKKEKQDIGVERQSFYDLFLEAPLSMGILRGTDHLFEVANPLYLALISKEDIIGKAFKNVLPELVDQGFLELLDSVYRTGKSYSATEMLMKLNPGGKPVDKYLNFVFHAYKNSKTKVDGILFFAVDVTEQVLSRKRVEESELRLNEAQVIGKVGNWEVDLARNAHYWSDEIYRIFGVAKGDIVPSEKAFMAFFHPEDLAESYRKIEEGFRTFEDISFDFRFIQKSGSIRYGHNQWKFKFDKNGLPAVLSGIIQDVTERKETEQLLRNSEADLVQRNADLEQFTYIVSHNLRAPVANILGLVNIWNGPGLVEEDKKMLSKGLHDSVTKLDDIVRDLNKILQTKGVVEEPSEMVHFSDLVRDIKVSIKNVIDSGQVIIECDFAQVDDFLTLKSYLHSIFYNLITNSIKYRRPELSSVIKINSHRVGNKIELIFSDNGMGVDMEKRGSQVFGLYKRFHPAIEGKGMGLFMVKTQVEKLGGRISLSSAVNKGAEFKIEFDL